jgi:DNA polymerase I-like protein with 3'-5' exonuclease and polymerase domains
MHEEKILWVEISQLFLDLGVLKIFQNGGYDMSILGRYYGLRVPRECYGDIMWCFQARHPYLLKRLAVLVSYYTWEPFYKDEGKVWGGRRTTDEAEFFYNCKDAACTREIWPIVTQDCRQADSWQTYSNHMRNFTSLLRMQTRGVVFDTPRKLALQEKWTADCAAIEQRIKARLSEEML